MNEMSTAPKLSLIKAYDLAPDIRPAGKTACGTMPAAAFQYCEAMRVASSFGWHVYCPIDLSLFFDGREVFFHDDGRWATLKSINLPNAFRKRWNAIAPPEMAEMDPPFLTQLFVPGVVQIWSGYLIKSADNWATNIRPPVNFDTRSSLSLFEGIVETNIRQYMPLFINLRLTKTDVEIHIPTTKPLFQIQPIHRSCYQKQPRDIEVFESRYLEDDPEVWHKYSQTIRRTEEAPTSRPGRYASTVRKQETA